MAVQNFTVAPKFPQNRWTIYRESPNYVIFKKSKKNFLHQKFLIIHQNDVAHATKPLASTIKCLELATKNITRVYFHQDGGNRLVVELLVGRAEVCRYRYFAARWPASRTHPI